MSRYIIGVSGGADSMALLDMLVKQNQAVVVAHVNYHQRETSDRDQAIVSQYCQQHDVPLRVLDDYFERGNFENHARVVRYRFFAQLCREYEADGVMVAHQFDDDLETYLLQKQRGSRVEYYGLRPETILHGVKVLRPLLHLTKQQLETYCLEQGIATGFDETNASMQFARNRLRLQLSALSMDEKLGLLKERDQDNIILQKTQSEVVSAYNQFKGQMNVFYYKQIPYFIRISVLVYWLRDENINTSRFSGSFLNEIDRQIDAQNREIPLGDGFVLAIEYGEMKLHKKESIGFSYQFTNVLDFECPYFRLQQHGETIEALSLKADDFPITVRAGKSSDVIQLRFGHKQLSRFWIDRKIRPSDRGRWVVVENAQKQIIFVAGLGADVAHFTDNPTLFVIK